MNQLKNYLSDKARFWLYLVFAVLALLQGATLTGLAEAGVAAPLWLEVAGSVYLYVSAAFGFTAATHTKPQAPEPVPVESKDEDTLFLM